MGRFSILKLLSKSPAAARNFQLRKQHSPASWIGLSGHEDSGTTTLSSLIGKVKRPISVTDFLDVLWCEKQMEFRLHYGPRRVTDAMKRGSAIHDMFDKAHKSDRCSSTGADSHSQEAYWANELFGYIKDIVKLMDMKSTDVEPYVTGNKSKKDPHSFSELKLLACVEGQWITGKIDLMEMTQTNLGVELQLKDYKSTRGGKPSYGAVRDRYQLMLYKLIWDSLLKGEFQLDAFMDHFGLLRQLVLPQGLRDEIAAYGLHVATVEQVVSKYVDLFKSLPLVSDRMYIRYIDRDLPQHTPDQRAPIEEEVSYNHEVVMTKLRRGISFWKREIEPEYTHQKFKCISCDYPECPRHPKKDEDLEETEEEEEDALIG